MVLFSRIHNLRSCSWLWQCLWFIGTTCCCCCCCHRLASKGRSVAPRWPRLTAHLQRSAGGRLLSFRIWSTHLLRGRSGRRCHWLLGGRPRDRLTWQLSALWAGTSSGSLATWPKSVMTAADGLAVSEMDERQVDWSRRLRHYGWTAWRYTNLALSLLLKGSKLIRRLTAGASSTIFWCRRCTLQSLSNKYT